MRIYKSKSAPEEPVPIGIFAHGGGFVAGSLDSEDSFCRTLVERIHTVIVSVDYRLAPENKVPAHLEDMLQAFQWVSPLLPFHYQCTYNFQAHDNASSFNGNPNNMYTIGGSAGGILSLAVARQVVLGRTSVPSTAMKGIIALVPGCLHPDNVPEKFKKMYNAYTENATNVPMIDGKSMDDVFGMTGIDAHNADYNVGLDSEAHKRFPPTYIATCEFDPLRDDGRIMAHALREAGVPVKYDHYDGLPHAFWFVPQLPETAVFMKQTVAGLEWILEKM